MSFSTASGKSVQWSEEALKKAREIFSDIDNSKLPPPQEHNTFGDKSNVSPMDKGVHISEEVHSSKNKHLIQSNNISSFGFSTASGKHVSVSETSLQKAKANLQEFDDIANFKEATHLKKQCTAEISDLTSVSNTPERVTALEKNFVCLQNKKENGFNGDFNKSVTNTHSTDSTPLLKEITGQSNRANQNVYFTSRTPENYFEIEAAESAKAFMDDDDLMDGGLPAEDTESYSSKSSYTRIGKRLRTEEGTSRGEPLIKRQLLPEFDRTENRPKLLLKPLTSTPEGTLKDRRKFLYNFALKPVICEPTSILTTGPDVLVPRFTAPNQFHSKPHIFQHNSLLKSTDVPASENQPSTSGTTRTENANNLPISKRDVKTFVPPFKKKSDSLSSNQINHTPETDCDVLINNITEDPGKEIGVRPVANILEDRLNESDILQMISNLQCARDMQEMRIRKKQRQKIKPQPGSQYLLKTSSAARISLQNAVQGKRPSAYSEKQLHRYGVVKNHIGITSENAESFQFNCMDYFAKDHLISGNGVKLADGGWLIPSNTGKAGKEEIYRALCDTPGVDPKLICPKWVYNHYRWIVWKLAALEVTFPDMFASRCLTPERVLLQLKYRYDVEIDKSQRSAIRKIMERDDSPAKTLVLCISKIFSVGLPHQGNNKSESSDSKPVPAVIEVTDGWYSIKALLDPALTALLRRGRMFIGQKIIVHGAELTGSEDACTPLEAPESIMLKIAANSTRPACWYTRLGYFHDPRPYYLPLSSLFSEGGIVGCVDVVIQRIYPMQWMEKMANGLYIFRNDRAEEKEAEKYSVKHQKNLEALFVKIQAEFEQQEASNRKKKGPRRRTLNEQQIRALQDGAELYEAIQNESDPGYLESCLSSEQLRALHSHRQLINDKKQTHIQAEFRKAIEATEHGPNGCLKRDVTAVWKVRITDYRDPDRDTAYILNIWRPLSDVISLLKEGSRYKMYHLAASQSKGKSEIAEVQFTATKKTRFQQLQPSQNILEQIYSPREAIKFSHFLDPFFRAPYSEVDVVGLVVSTYKKPGAAPVVYLSDESHNLVAVKFWTDLGQLALDDVTKPCTFIAACNLRWRSDSRSDIPTVFAGDLSFVSSNPKEYHLLKALQELKNSIQCFGDFCNEAETKLRKVLQVKEPEVQKSPTDKGLEPHTPTMKIRAAGEGNYLSNGSLKKIVSGYTPDLNTAHPSSSGEIDIKTCKKRKGLDFLCRIPSPPPVTPVRPFVSPALQKAFRAPRSSGGQRDCTGNLGANSNLKATISHRSKSVADSEGGFVADEELAMINTQALLMGLDEGKPKTDQDLPASDILSNNIPISTKTPTVEGTPQLHEKKLRKRKL
ncbi:breast cancer type 2 susceptibility protein [Discoglossus pictus]